MNRRKPPRSRSVQPLSTEAIQFKFSRIVSRQEELKLAFNQLNSQIRTGLLEAEDVFASLAIPLMKLVGLKTVEMASEGRFSSILTCVDQSFYQDDNSLSSAVAAGDELIEKQNLQLRQLINLLKSIEAHVNSSQNSIFESLANHQDSIKQYFRKAFTYVFAIHQSSHSKDLSFMMLKLLKATFDQVGVALSSVEDGVDDLMRKLAEKMCSPMVEYVNGLKAEMKIGTCLQLVKAVKEMDGVMKVAKFELEEARKRARLAEESRTETLSKLLKSEEIARKLTISLESLTEDCIESDDVPPQQQISCVKENHQAKDDNLIWELLRKNMNCQVPDSPPGPNGFLGIQKYDRRLNLTRANPPLNHRSLTRSQIKGLDPQSPFMNTRLLLGLSPSATTRKVPRKRKTP